jgi:zinc transport system ATP-binding protein
MISIKGLSFSFGDKVILSDITMDIEDLDFLAVIGPNGAGKSTLVKILLGILTGYTGEITIDGIPHKRWLKDHQVGYVPQREQFSKEFPASALDIVLMGRANSCGWFRPFRKTDRELAMDALKMVNAEKLSEQQIGSLSGGEFQRVILARALAANSDYLFLDEPEAGVDEHGTSDFYSLLGKFREKGKTILLVSHDIGMVTEYCRTIVCLNRTLHCHTPSELLTAEAIQKTYGEAMQLIERKHH